MSEDTSGKRVTEPTKVNQPAGLAALSGVFKLQVPLSAAELDALIAERRGRGDHSQP
jgi:hypothetical protein